MLGVIGGMGPLATADFFRKLIDATPARDDDEHIPVLIHSVPQIPSRPAAILRGGPSPLPALRRGARPPARRGRHDAGDAVQHRAPLVRRPGAGCAVPFVHIVDAVADAASGRRA